MSPGSAIVRSGRWPSAESDQVPARSMEAVSGMAFSRLDFSHFVQTSSGTATALCPTAITSQRDDNSPRYTSKVASPADGDRIFAAQQDPDQAPEQRNSGRAEGMISDFV